MNPEPSQGSHFFHNLSSFSRPLLHRALRRRAGGRLGLARETGGRGPHRARPARAHRGAPRPARGRALAPRVVARDARTLRERMNPTPDKPIDRILHDLQERAKELNCLYRVDELLGPGGGDPRRRPRRGDPHHPRRLAVPGRVRRPDRPRQPGVRAPGLRALALQDGRPRRGAGRDRRPGRGLLHGGDAAGGRGPVPRGGEEAPRRHQRAHRALRLASPAAARPGRRRRRGPGGPGVVGGARLPAPDRPRAARPAGPQDDQPPLLERRRGGRAPPALDRSRPHLERRGDRRRQPAPARAPRGPPTRRRPTPPSASRAGTSRRTRSSAASRAGSRRTSPPS